MRSVSEKINQWLNNKLNSSKNGIILDDPNINSSFEIIQNFLEDKEHPFKTFAIYYNAFAEESAVEFINTLSEELSGKFSSPKLEYCSTLSEIIATAELRMVIIDQSYLYPLETINQISKCLNKHHVGLILVGSLPQMNHSKILRHPIMGKWDRLKIHNHQAYHPDDNLALSC